MKVAVSTDNGMVSEHFGRCPEFTIAEIKSGKVVKKEVVGNPGHATGFIPKFLHEAGVNCMIAGGAGFRAQEFFKEFGIELVLGVSGPVDSILQDFATGKLKSGQSSCMPQSGRGYGIPKEDGHEE